MSDSSVPRLNRRERIIAHLKEHPGQTSWELAVQLGRSKDSGAFRTLLSDMQRKGQVTAVTQWRPKSGRAARLWSAAPAGTKPQLAIDPHIERRREQDRAYRRRVRAIARGEDPGPAGLIPVKQVRLPVGAPDRGNWRARAACSGVDPDLFFSLITADIAKAQQVCAGCPVRPDCHQLAEANDTRYGVWAGLNFDIAAGATSWKEAQAS